MQGLIESNTTFWEGQGIQSECPRFAIHDEACKSWDTRTGFPRCSLSVAIDYFSHSCLKMCKKKRCKMHTGRDFSRLLGFDVLMSKVIYFQNGIVSPSRVGQHFAWHQIWGIFLSQEWEKNITCRMSADIPWVRPPPLVGSCHPAVCGGTCNNISPAEWVQTFPEYDPLPWSDRVKADRTLKFLGIKHQMLLLNG